MPLEGGSTIEFLLVSIDSAEVPPTVMYGVYFEMVQFLGFLVFGSAVDILYCIKFWKVTGPILMMCCPNSLSPCGYLV